MARMKPLDPTDVPELADVFEIKRKTLGFVPNSALTMARWPELARAYGALSAAIADTRKLPLGLANLVFLMASSAAGCQYCVAHSTSKADSDGILGAKLDEIWDFEDSRHFDDAERAALRLAQAAGVTPAAVTDDHFEDLRVHFDDDAIVEIVGVIAFSGFMNRWNATMGTSLEENPRAIAEQMLSSKGWDIGPHGQ